jgi:hypothetical protein
MQINLSLLLAAIHRKLDGPGSKKPIPLGVDALFKSRPFTLDSGRPNKVHAIPPMMILSPMSAVSGSAASHSRTLRG